MKVLQIEAAARLYSSKVTTSLLPIIGTGRKCSDVSNSSASTKGTSSHDSGGCILNNSQSATSSTFSYPKLLMNPKYIEKLSGGKYAHQLNFISLAYDEQYEQNPMNGQLKIFEDQIQFLGVNSDCMQLKVQDLMTTFLYRYDVGIEILVAALIYSERISSLSFTERTSKNLLLTALALASKFFQDKFERSTHFFTMLTQANSVKYDKRVHMTQMLNAYLEFLDFRLVISEADYSSMMARIKNLIAKKYA